MMAPCIVQEIYANLWRVRGPVWGDFEGLFVSVAGLSGQARFRWSCLFENYKHGQTHLSSHFLTENDEGIPFFTRQVYVFSQKPCTCEVKDCYRNLSMSCGCFTVFLRALFFGTKTFVLVCSGEGHCTDHVWPINCFASLAMNEGSVFSKTTRGP